MFCTMDDLWSKNRLHKIFSKDSLAMTSNANASGDGSTIMRFCRLCGGDTSLRGFTETYNCEGIEERYDQLLYECFGVRVHPSDCLICDHCVRQLRNINRFRSLVYTAFVKQSSENASKEFHLGIGEGHLRCNQNKTKEDSDGTVNRLKDMGKQRKRKTEIVNVPKKREMREVRRDRRISAMNTSVVVKRMNIACVMCKQRYSMIVPFEGWKEFLCSRCKKKSQVKNGEKTCKLKMASSVMKEYLMLQSKPDLRGHGGLCCLSKRSTQVSKTEVASRVQQRKYQCCLCPKKYVVSQHLAHHMSSVHGEKLRFDSITHNKSVIKKEAIEKPKRTHTGQAVFQCDVCLRTFKGKRSFQSHYSTHGK